MTYTRMKQIWRHTPTSAGVWQYQAFSLCETQPKQCTDNTHCEIRERAATQDLNTLNYLQNTQQHLKYGATHLLWQVPPLCNTRPDKCTDQAQGETWQRIATQTPTHDYPHLTKQIWCHTPALVAPLSLYETPSDKWPEKAYSEIQSAQPIRPQPLSLENYNMTTNQIRHTPTSAGTFPL
ncbi:hypothetical protein BS47DRAFT_1369919 [Hydnum rufescens UP504]|uniref:Uncharacterized protein n=1 Tax=Hydnum rufescens UP504 TaxID=1448309 RepID=A0A9P6DLC3_9AGAM|nr:hypothetical protein BS47DRAFT_1369919 [Hydnum rufescens UP504]